MLRASAQSSLLFTLSSFFLVAGLISVGAFSTNADAQTVSGATAPNPLTIDVTPEYPTPYQTVTVTPSSSTFDIDASTISVTVNGTPFYKGTGGAGITVPVGGAGTVTKIIVTATDAGQKATQEVTLRPASVALVVEPDSSTHPFYPGGSLVPSEGRVRLIAIPELVSASGKKLDPSTLEYTWKSDDNVLDGDSGIGQSVLNATAPQRYRDTTVSVTVSDPNSPLIAEASEDISPVDPITRVYENDPLLGPLFDTALPDSFTMTDAEDTFRGVPYYFSNPPSISWMVNSVPSGTDQDITVRSTGTGTGTAVLNFSASDASIETSANSTVSVAFGQPSSGGIFGL
jgi:ribosomal protein L31